MPSFNTAGEPTPPNILNNVGINRAKQAGGLVAAGRASSPQWAGLEPGHLLENKKVA